MKWQQLLTAQRSEERAEDAGDEFELRSEFEKDYHSVIESAAFRRLQDKTQVFPLDRSDFIRTRLTHSLEVSSIGRALAQNISQAILTEGLDPDFGEREKNAVTEILQCVGLIHDIGNPPFGHFGEEAIREWFRGHLPGICYHGKPVCEILTEQELADFTSFEGNAQGFRVVTKLNFPGGASGMNLTHGVLSAMIKYPRNSLTKDPSSPDAAAKKTGYFGSEERLFREIARETGTGNVRNPLAFMLEAADDIAYATADIEDAYKKGFFDYPTLVKELKARDTDGAFVRSLTELRRGGTRRGAENPGEYAIRTWLVRMQDVLIRSATGAFVRRYRDLMCGSMKEPLISEGRAFILLKNLKEIAYDYAFTSMSIYKTEIAANRILTDLLDKLVPAALAWDEPERPGLLEEKYISLIPEDYRHVCRTASRGKSERERAYLKLLMVTDSLSGMTDSYARNLCMELNGMEL